MLGKVRVRFRACSVRPSSSSSSSGIALRLKRLTGGRASSGVLACDAQFSDDWA